MKKQYGKPSEDNSVESQLLDAVATKRPEPAIAVLGKSAFLGEESILVSSGKSSKKLKEFESLLADMMR